MKRGNNFYMLDCAAWASTQQSSSTYTSRGQDPASYNSGNPWSPMTAVFKYIITEAMFTQNAYFGSFIINNDWMISQHGTVNGAASTNYTAFDPNHPNDNTGSNFIPNFAVDGKTGTSYQKKGYIGGFAIGATTLTNSNWNAGIDISYDSKNVKIGKNAAGTVNTEQAIIRAENTKSWQTYNTALYLNAQNATYNYAFYGNGNGVLNGLVFGFKVNALSVAGSSDATYNLDLKDGATVIFTGSRTSGTARVYMPKISDIRKALGITSTSVKFAFEYALSNQTSGSGTVKLIFRSYPSGNSEYPYRTNFDNNYTGDNYEVPMATGDYAKILLIWDGSVYKAFVIRYIDGGWGV